MEALLATTFSLTHCNAPGYQIAAELRLVHRFTSEQASCRYLHVRVQLGT
jgi:hypothetical protein